MVCFPRPRRGWDHPRSRGEYAGRTGQRPKLGGSSPLSRGILSRVTSSRIHSGIIPALAGNTSKSTRPPLLGRDHLRSRGEYVSLPSTPHMIVGSSPLSRGIPVAILSCQVGPRIIPALAGNTLMGSEGAPSRADHPRSRGEYLGDQMAELLPKGSSPLSRGIRQVATQPLRAIRIIPALAGNTGPIPTASTLLRDHPRSRGEYPLGVVISESALGSSPLSRGIPRLVPVPAALPGIIPALAGNTCLWQQGLLRRWDHPRSRGEYVLVAVDGGEEVGIIPALAGNTLQIIYRQVDERDHPRSRGEYHRHLISCGRAPGSSPLSRGIRNLRRLDQRPRGIIPALAGNTRLIISVPRTSEDHPRSRGEYTRSMMAPIEPEGSSPLSRGIPRSRAGAPPEGGIIPALAGNTLLEPSTRSNT